MATGQQGESAYGAAAMTVPVEGSLAVAARSSGPRRRWRRLAVKASAEGRRRHPSASSAMSERTEDQSAVAP